MNTSWPPEPATNQVRPKDLRDEFAMMAWVAISADKKHLYAVAEDMGATMEDAVARLAYLYADAMMEVREAK